MKFFKKKFNILLMSIGIFVIVAIAGALVLTNPFLIKAKVISSLPKFLRPYVKIGDVELNLLQGLKLKELQLNDITSEQSPPLFTTPLVNITPKQKPLVFGQWIPDIVEIASPVFNLKSSSKGGETSWNVVELVTNIVEQTTGIGMEQLPSELKITDGKIVFDDEKLRKFTSVDRYQLSDFDFDFKKTTEATYSFEGSFDDPKLGRLTFKGVFEGEPNGDIDVVLALTGDGTIELQPQMRENLKGELAEVWDTFNPAGKMQFKSLKISVQTTEGKPQLHYALVTELKDMASTFVDFPYPMTDITGTVELSDEAFTIREPVEVTLKNESREVLEITGGLSLPLKTSRVNIHVQSKGYLTFDDKLRRAMIPLNRDLWQTMLTRTQTRYPDNLKFWDWYRPHGKAKVTYITKGPILHPDVFMTLKFANTDFLYKEFPYPLKEVDVTAEVTPEEVRIQNLHDELAGGGFIKVNGVIDNLKRVPQVNLSVECKDLPLDNTLRNALDERGQRSWDYVHPQGKVDIDAKFIGDAVTPSMRINTTMKDATFHIEDVAVPFEHINGVVVFFNDRDEIDLTGRVLDTEMTLTGRIDHPLQGLEKTNLTMVINDVDLSSATLRRSLKLPDQDIWQTAKSRVGTGEANPVKTYDWFQPRGLADATISITGTGENLSPTYDVQFKGAIARFVYFPYPLQDITGRVIFAPDTTEFKNLVCKNNGSVITVNGAIKGDTYETDIAIDSENLAMNDDLLDIFREDNPDFFEEYDVTGSCIVHARLYGKGGIIKSDITAIPKENFNIHSKTFNMDIADVQGQFRFIDDKTMINIVGKTPDDTIVTISNSEIEGKGKAARVKMSVLVENLKLDKDVYQGLDKKAQKALESLNIEGLADVILDITKNEGRHAKENVTIQIKAKDLSIREEHFSYTLKNLSGTISIVNENIAFDLSSTTPDGQNIEIEGRQTPVMDTDTALLEFTKFNINGIPLDDAFFKALPGDISKVLTDMKLAGKLGLKLDSLDIMVTEDKKIAKYSGKLLLEDLSLAAGVPVKKLSGAISFNGSFEEYYDAGLPTPLKINDNRMIGRVNVDRINIDDKDLLNIGGDFLLENNYYPELDKVNKLTMSFNNISGPVYGGEYNADLKVDLSKGILYGMNATLQGTDLEEFANDMLGYEGEQLSGELDGKLSVQGYGAEKDELFGMGNIKISEGRLYKIPILLSVLNILNLSLPERTAFTEGEADFVVQKGDIQVRDIRFIGNAFAIQGEGTISGDNIDLLFSLGPGRQSLFRLPILSNAYGGIVGNVVTIKATGTFKKPETYITTFPFQ